MEAVITLVARAANRSLYLAVQRSSTNSADSIYSHGEALRDGKVRGRRSYLLVE